jgi:hypothetical protein
VHTLSHPKKTPSPPCFQLDDLDDYVATAAQQDTSSTLQTWAEAQRADWPLYRDQMKQRSSRCAERATRWASTGKTEVCGLFRRRPSHRPSHRAYFFGQFSIYLTDGKTPCTLECAMLRQTATG